MKRGEIQMTQGAIIPNVLRFSIPIILSNLLQITFSAADTAVVGWFCGSNAVAAIGSISSLVHLLLGLFIGLSAGISVAVSFALGAKDEKKLSLYTHNAVALSLICGVFIAFIGVFIAQWAIVRLGVPYGEIRDGAILYFRIYFMGAPVLLFYNFGSAILRANGDTRRPFLYLSIGGALNVILNLVFVLVFDMTVDGVAIATVVSNLVAALLVLRRLMQMEGPCRLFLRKIRIHKEALSIIIKFGLPAGIQGCMYSLPNLMIQSSINSFGAAAVAGNAAATNVGSYYEATTPGFSEAAITFMSRNHGAGHHGRIRKIAWRILWVSALLSLVLGIGAYLFCEPLLSIFIPGNEEGIRYGAIRLLYLAVPNFACTIMHILTSQLRGIGKPVFPMVTTIIGVCVVRVVWILTIYKMYPSIECVYFTFPFTWTLTSLVMGAYLLLSLRKLQK